MIVYPYSEGYMYSLPMATLLHVCFLSQPLPTPANQLSPLAAAAAAQINDSEGSDNYFYRGFLRLRDT